MCHAGHEVLYEGVDSKQAKTMGHTGVNMDIVISGLIGGMFSVLLGMTFWPPKNLRFLFSKWTFRLAIFGFALGYFSIIGKGYIPHQHIGFIIGVGLGSAIMFGILGLVIDLVKSIVTPNVPMNKLVTKSDSPSIDSLKSQADTSPVTKSGSEPEMCPSNNERDDLLWEQVYTEFEQGPRDIALLARLTVECNGDETKIRVAYLKNRYANLLKEYNAIQPQSAEF